MKRFIFIAGIFCFGATPQGCNKKDCTENVQTECICTQQYDPVCGCNGKTYGNACTAKCHGITKYVKGECPQ